MGLPSLYKLASQHQELEQLATDEELDETMLEAIRNTIDGLAGDLQTKSQSVAAVVLNMEAWAKAAKEASKQLAERAKRIDRRAEALRGYIHTALEAAGLPKIEGAEFTVAIRKNPPSVHIAPETDLGDEWMTFYEAPPPAPNKKAIAEALKSGKEIRGCSMVSTTRLDIRS